MKKNLMLIAIILVSCDSYQYDFKTIEKTQEEKTSQTSINSTLNEIKKAISPISIIPFVGKCNSITDFNNLTIASFQGDPGNAICVSSYKITFPEPISLESAKSYFINISLDYKLKFFTSYSGIYYGLYSDNIDIGLMNNKFKIRAIGSIVGYDINENNGQPRSLIITSQIQNLTENEKLTAIIINVSSHYRKSDDFPIVNFPVDFFKENSSLKINSIQLTNQP